MNPELRILICSLLEKMKQDEEYARRLGLEDNSRILVQNADYKFSPAKEQEKRHKM